MFMGVFLEKTISESWEETEPNSKCALKIYDLPEAKINHTDEEDLSN